MEVKVRIKGMTRLEEAGFWGQRLFCLLQKPHGAGLSWTGRCRIPGHKSHGLTRPQHLLGSSLGRAAPRGPLSSLAPHLENSHRGSCVALVAVTRGIHMERAEYAHVPVRLTPLGWGQGRPAPTRQAGSLLFSQGRNKWPRDGAGQSEKGSPSQKSPFSLPGQPETCAHRLRLVEPTQPLPWVCRGLQPLRLLPPALAAAGTTGLSLACLQLCPGPFGGAPPTPPPGTESEPPVPWSHLCAFSREPPWPRLHAGWSAATWA